MSRKKMAQNSLFEMSMIAIMKKEFTLTSFQESHYLALKTNMMRVVDGQALQNQ